MTISIQRRVGRRYRTAGKLTVRGRRGRNSISFSGRLSGRALAAGRYRARLRARDRAGNASSTRTLTFRVVG